MTVLERCRLHDTRNEFSLSGIFCFNFFSCFFNGYSKTQAGPVAPQALLLTTRWPQLPW